MLEQTGVPTSQEENELLKIDLSALAVMYTIDQKLHRIYRGDCRKAGREQSYEKVAVMLSGIRQFLFESLNSLALRPFNGNWQDPDAL